MLRKKLYGVAALGGLVIGCSSSSPPPAQPPADASAPRSSLPSVLYDIDPALPAVQVTTVDPSAGPGLQIDASNVVQAMTLANPAHTQLVHGGGYVTLISGGIEGYPYLHGTVGAEHGYDGLVFPASAAAPIIATAGQPFAMAIVVRTNAAGGTEMLKLYKKAVDVHVLLHPADNGALSIGENDGPATIAETSAPALNQWDLVFYVYDGQTYALYRNGIRVAQTVTWKGGGWGARGIESFMVMNGMPVDVARLIIAANAPSIDQLNAEAQRLAGLYPGLVRQPPITEGNANPTSFPEFVDDETFLTTPNWPLTTPLPVNDSATLGDGLALAAGARNAFSLIMGGDQPGANMTTSQSIRDVFFMNYLSGDQNTVIGSPVDTGQGNNNTFAAVARHYAPGDPADLHVMANDGMHLRAVCTQSRSDCTPGHVFAAMVRLPFEWRPGSTLKVRYKSPPGDHSWAPIWLFSGSQISPGAGGNPYQGFGTASSLIRTPNKGFEIDWNDNYSRFGAGVPTGFHVDYGTPDIYGVQWTTAPHGVYWANGNGYTFHPNAGPEFEQLPFNWAAELHDLVGNWRGDGSNLLDLFVDGHLISTLYMEYPQDTYVDPVDGQTKTIAMHLIIGNQAIPSFAPGASTAIDNDGIPDGWTIVVQEISGWYGNVANPDSYRPAPNGI